MSHKFNNYGLVTSLAAATLLSLCLTSNGNVKADTQSPVNIEQKNKSAELIKQNSDISASAQQHNKNANGKTEDTSTQSTSTDLQNTNGKTEDTSTQSTSTDLQNTNTQKSFKNQSQEPESSTKAGEVKTLKDFTFSQNGKWSEQKDGIHSDARGQGDSFAYTKVKGDNFMYSADVVFQTNQGAAAITFRGNNDPNNKDGYAVNVDASSHKAKFWRWHDNKDYQLIDERDVKQTADNTYNLKVVANGHWLEYFVNDVLVASNGDYTLQKGDKGQPSVTNNGYFGLLNWNSNVIFKNVKYTKLDQSFTPLVSDITVTSDKGKVEEKGQFSPEQPIYIQYVDNDASTVNLKVKTDSPKAKVVAYDLNNNAYTDLKNIPVQVGANYLTVVSEVTASDGTKVESVYRINVHRLHPNENYYNELYRDQYHFSVKEGWSNDPNGLVYFNGKYHMFYQFYDDTIWGPMHWAHATSKDLIHWKNEPIALYPDANGAMFSGSIVVDKGNTSGLFDNDKGGLVALVTTDGNGQRIELAYSRDEGKTWNKLPNLVADWQKDPLQVQDFRDPKVFRWNDKWFMVLAGGPLRIYSSTNLQNWQVESEYSNINTECPDLYPIRANDGQLKWVLSRGGRFYKIGDFKEVNGKWSFIPDEAYKDQDGIMNFGKDSYAAMTYYQHSFGTEKDPTLPDIIEENWMNNWDYCNLVGNTVGQSFNGTYNLNLKVGLVKDGDKYLLTQTPIKAYEALRDNAHKVEYKDVTVTPNNDLFKNFKGDSYEIVSTFRPSKSTTKVGFNVRVGKGQATKVIYDLTTNKIYIDRSKSGVQINNKFSELNEQPVTRNADGSISLHLYVDRASVEAFTKGDTVLGANQIFPAPQSLGLQVVSEGGDSKADITLYPMKSVWTDKQKVNKPLEIVQVSPKEVRLNVGDSTTLTAYVMPGNVSQALDWSVNDESLASITKDPESNSLKIVAKKTGTLTVTVKSHEDPSLSKTYKITILKNNFKTNIKNLKPLSGDWYINDKDLHDENVSSNDYIMSPTKIPSSEYDINLDVKYQKGLVNIFFASANEDPNGAYSLQLGGDKTLRLFRFYGDTITTTDLPAALNDGKLHHVAIHKTQKTVKVTVDGETVMDYTFNKVDPGFNDAYIGLGLWDGTVDFQNLYVKTPTKNSDNSSSSIDINDQGIPSISTDDNSSIIKKASENIQPIVFKTKILMHNAFVYNDTGKHIVKIILKAGSVLKVGKIKFINNKRYYQLDNDKYIKAANIDAFVRRLRRNAFVYNHIGKHIKNSLIRKGKKVKTYGSPVVIKGIKYYIVGNNRYIKAVNFM